MLRESVDRTASDPLAWHMEHSAVFLSRSGQPHRPRHKRDYANTTSISRRRAASGELSAALCKWGFDPGGSEAVALGHPVVPIADGLGG